LDDPILHYEFSLRRDPAERGRWHRTVDYFVWTDMRGRDDPPLSIWELHRGGAVRIPDTDMSMHVIRGGTPHHIEHLFGYWRVCDTDIVAFRSVQADGVYHALVLGGCPGAYNKDAILWVCPKCAHILGCHEVATGRIAWDRFWVEEEARVRDFNADPSRRTCARCGCVHPNAYRFDPTHDSAAERAARETW
jgi:hypothetical protein